MPGNRRGPGKWIETRANRILEGSSDKSPEARGRAFAIATLQAHKVGKAPKRGAGVSGKFGTNEARALAREKFKLPVSEYRKTAAMANLSGRDNRSPFVGRTQFPTEGSKQPAISKLRTSSSVGSITPPKPTKVTSFGTQKALARLTPTAALSKLAGMSPLARFLTTPEGQHSLEKLSEALDTNQEFSEDAKASPRKRFVGAQGLQDMVRDSRGEQRRILKTLFENHASARVYAKD